MAQRFVTHRGRMVPPDNKWAWSPELVRTVLETFDMEYNPAEPAVRQARAAEKALMSLWG